MLFEDHVCAYFYFYLDVLKYVLDLCSFPDHVASWHTYIFIVMVSPIYILSVSKKIALFRLTHMGIAFVIAGVLSFNLPICIE